MARLEAVVDSCQRAVRFTAPSDAEAGAGGGGGGRGHEKTATITGAMRLVRQLAIVVSHLELQHGVATR